MNWVGSIELGDEGAENSICHENYEGNSTVLPSFVVGRGVDDSSACQAASRAGNAFHAKARRPPGLQRVALTRKTGDRFR